MLLRVEDLWLSYEKRPILRGVSLSLEPGEIAGLVGSSGAGKTSLALAILGLLPPSASIRGTILFEGANLLAASPRTLRDLRGRRIASVFQDPHASLNPVMRVCDQLSETIRAHRTLPKAERMAEAESALVNVGLEDRALHRAYPHELSGGQAQRVLIAQALVHRPALLIADEPTGSLDTITQAEVIKLLRKLIAASATAILFITHQPALLEGFATQRLHLKQGSFVPSSGELPVNPPAASAPAHPSTAPTPAPLVEVRRLHKTYRRRTQLLAKSRLSALAQIDLTLFVAARTSLVGASGSGKSTLARCLAYLETWDEGEIRYSPSLPRWQLAQVVPQSAGASLNSRFTALQAIEEPLRIQLHPHARDRALELLDAMALPRSASFRRVTEFSGGERARIALARALALSPKLLILDETLTSLDPDTQSRIVELLDRWRRVQNFALLTITHDLDLAIRVADEIVVLEQGRLVERLPASAFLHAARTPPSRRLIDARPGTHHV